ncbi:MAG TPA: putative baseplate assembly protein, partial [Acidobacteriota bacterium]|nr:putative baseplate assembly protein [Acidobacteriota bacterium]
LQEVGSHKGEEQKIFPSPKLVWEILNLDGNWELIPIGEHDDKTYGLTESGRLLIHVPSEMKNNDGLYWLQCRLEEGAYEIVPLISRVLLNTVSAVQLETVRYLEVGEGRGTPYQKFYLTKVPVVWGTRLTNRFHVEDVLDWSAFMVQFNNMNLFSKASATDLTDEDKSGAIDALNKLCEQEDLHKLEFLKNIILATEEEKLLEKGLDHISTDEWRTINQFLIQTAFPSIFSRSAQAGNRMVLRVREDGKWEEWFEKKNFENSGPNDRHYTLDPTKGEITFGNGLNGRIPGEREKIEAHYYRTSLGRKGNIPKGQRFEFNNKFGKIVGQNYKPALGGRNAETIEETINRARKEFRIPAQAVTATDYEQLALWTPGLRVARSKALLNHNPDYPCTSIPGVITLVVVPYARKGTTRPMPGTDFKRSIQDHLNRHRLVTSAVYVVGPHYVEISVKCKVRIVPRNDPTKVVKGIQDTLDRFLDPFVGGPEKNGWPFGRSVFASELYQVIDGVEGVDFASNLSILTDLTDQTQATNIVKLPPAGLTVSGKHQIEYES